ncbi:hypothetical protein VNI00_012949 [Paramarasmius palmivorus]|uniref:Uncharacterized protein n=1 Tax=Paramarasmius palmivorus TaxID=297713 RepID=A0AAW0C0D3_9AGAR
MEYINHIDFMVSIYESEDNDTLPSYVQILHLLREQADRVFNLALYLTDHDLPEFISIMGDLEVHFTKLTKLIVEVENCDDPCELVAAFSESPFLRTIHMWPCTPSPPYFPVTHLTNIVLGDTDADDFSTILITFPMLQSADVTFVDNSEYKDTTLSPDMSIPPLQHLRTLRVRFRDDDFVTFDAFPDLFGLFNFPALSSLLLQLPQQDMQSHRRGPDALRTLNDSLQSLANELISFVGRCPNVVDFHLISACLDEQHVMSILERMTNVVVFSIADISGRGRTLFTKDFLQELGDGKILPRLRDLSLELSRHELEKGAFEGMLRRARSTESARLFQSACLRVTRTTASDLDLEYLRELQREGFAVRVVQYEDEILGYTGDT